MAIRRHTDETVSSGRPRLDSILYHPHVYSAPWNSRLFDQNGCPITRGGRCRICVSHLKESLVLSWQSSTYGDYYFTAWGLVLTLLGTFLAALKTVATNLIQTGGGGRLKLVSLTSIICSTYDAEFSSIHLIYLCGCPHSLLFNVWYMAGTLASLIVFDNTELPKWPKRKPSRCWLTEW